jgi:hypothetical protein
VPLYEKVAAREDGLTDRLSLSPSRTLVTPYFRRIRPGCRITRATVFPLVFHLAPTNLGWDTQRQFTRRSREAGTPRGRNADKAEVQLQLRKLNFS